MIDKWFSENIEHLIKKRKRIVILDPDAQCGFLLPLLDLEAKGYKLIKTDSSLTEDWQTVKEELFLRHRVETEYKEDDVVFYVIRKQDKLSFLFDYCFTHGCIDLSNFAEWLKKKIFANTGLQVQWDSKKLLTAGKLSMRKEIAWWKKKVQGLEELVNLEDDLLPFLHDPENFFADKDTDIRKLYEEKIFELSEQPYIPQKTPETLANEVVKKLFDGLVSNNIPESLLQVYHRWADSESFRPSLNRYITKYKLDLSVNPWLAHTEHCFGKLDQKALHELSANLRDKSFVIEKMDKIKSRANSQAKAFVPSWWQDVITLMEFDSQPLAACNSFDKVVKFYTDYFAKVDRAIRNLYAHFLQEESIIRPLQEHYENLNRELLQQWFSYAGEYKSNQQGFLVSLFKKAEPKIAVIVGDGVRYEIADYVAETLDKQFKVEKKILLAGMPSETEHNMSALYLDNNIVLPVHKDREKKLLNLTGKPIVFMDIEALSYGEKADFLVLTYKDIDNAGEKLQQGVIKLFEEFEKLLKNKIELLLNIGYREVHLVTDHGFVLTGLLDESDKIEPHATGKKEVHERFIRTTDKQNNSEWLEFKEPYGEYNYVYASKSHRPFKSTGAYGFSHGGFTPQEIIIPNFMFCKENTVFSSLEVVIINKKDLAEVAGELFAIKLQTASISPNLFVSNRKVQVALYAGNVNYSSSNIINMKPGEIESLEFSFNRNTEVKVILLDADNKAQLDSVIVKRSNARDLGGLL